MFEVMKMSKFNYYVYDQDQNLIIYNFLAGVNSLTKVMKRDVDKFKMTLLKNDIILNPTKEICIETIEYLYRSGILVDNGVDENSLLIGKHYEEVCNNELCLTILPTGRCNFCCPYCYENSQDFYREAMTVTAQNNLLKFAYKNISKFSKMHVSWFGGEPLLEYKTISNLSRKFIEMCNKRFIPYSAEITTNGYLLDSTMFDVLYKLKVYTYMITIDGFKSQHDKQRLLKNGCGTYDIIMSNLINIRNNKQYKFANIIIRINVAKGFLDEFDDFVQFLSDTFADDKRFRFMFAPVTLDTDDDNYDMCIDPNELISYMQSNDVYITRLKQNESKLALIVPEPKCIAAKKNSYIVMPDLSISKCYSYFGNDINTVGVINENGDLLVNEPLHRKWYFEGKYVQNMEDRCENCFYLPCCRNSNPGCPIRYKLKGKINLCNLDDKNFLKRLDNSIVFAADRYKCNILLL